MDEAVGVLTCAAPVESCTTIDLSDAIPQDGYVPALGDYVVVASIAQKAAYDPETGMISPNSHEIWLYPEAGFYNSVRMLPKQPWQITSLSPLKATLVDRAPQVAA